MWVSFAVIVGPEVSGGSGMRGCGPSVIDRMVPARLLHADEIGEGLFPVGVPLRVVLQDPPHGFDYCVSANGNPRVSNGFSPRDLTSDLMKSGSTDHAKHSSPRNLAVKAGSRKFLENL